MNARNGLKETTTDIPHSILCWAGDFCFSENQCEWWITRNPHTELYERGEYLTRLGSFETLFRTDTENISSCLIEADNNPRVGNNYSRRIEGRGKEESELEKLWSHVFDWGRVGTLCLKHRSSEKSGFLSWPSHQHVHLVREWLSLTMFMRARSPVVRKALNLCQWRPVVRRGMPYSINPPTAFAFPLPNSSLDVLLLQVSTHE